MVSFILSEITLYPFVGTTTTMEKFLVKKEIAYGEVHKGVLSNLPKDELIKEYGKWAPEYDKHCLETKAYHKRIAAEHLLDFMESDGKKVRVLDAACGTGLVAVWVKRMADEKGVSAEITGVDISPDMLHEAEKKNLFSILQEADLYEGLNFPEEHFDYFLAVGLFIKGHVGPETLLKMTKHIKYGGIGVITVRRNTFEEERDEYLRRFNESGLSIVRNVVDKYLDGIDAHYIVVKRTHAVNAHI